MGTQKLALMTIGMLAAVSGLGQALTISVLLIDTCGAPKGVISAAQKDATRILAAAGVSLDWQPSTKPGGLSLRLVAQRIVPAKDEALGYSFVDPTSGEQGHLADLLYPAIEQTARQWQAGVSTILGAVMAHEIGHLLLDSHAHSSSGVMSASFGYTQITQAGKGELLFTADQAARIRSQVALRKRIGSSFHASSNPSETHGRSIG